ncbi:MAG TPA: thiamine pyrophosphate-binding protein, partial [Solirubrobacterales bacterium]|nr:thiamine pyrophosphate-binding protein [Solirubrobacterales bacterium]
MPTVRDASFDLLRSQGMTTIFGNPGSTELPMLADFPGDFQYVLGLQEAVVVGMADGFAQASGRPAVANLHTAPGVGNAMGAIFNAHANHSPLLITAGQQARAQMTLQANLTNRDATRLPHPLVKWSHEPPRPEDVPLALAHGLHLAALPPQGPVFVSIPMDDWDADVPEAEAREVVARGVDGRAVASPDSIRRLAGKLDSAANPVLVAGPDIDASGGWEAAIGLAERQRLPVWATPATGGGKLGFPENHPNYRGVLPPAIGPVAQTLEGHDLILVAGSSVFPYYPHIPGPLLPEGATLVAITSDPDEAARAPMGYAIVADVGLTLKALLEAAPESSRPGPEPNPGPEEIPAEDPLNSSTVHSALAEVFPEDVPLALAHGLHLAALPPQGPVFVSIPMDDWDAEMPEAEAREVVARGIDGRAVASPDSIRRLAEKLDSASNPVLVAGPDVDASGGWEAAIGLAERQRLPVWATPATGGGKLGFPENHPTFRGVLPPAIGPVAQTL